MLGGLIICTVYMLSHMGISVGESFTAMHEKGYTQIFGTDPMEKNFFIKQIIAGIYYNYYDRYRPGNDAEKPFCNQPKKDSQKNMVSLGFIMLVVIGLFLYMGGLLHLYGAREHVEAVGDGLFPAIALEHMSPVISVIFIIALISALFPSADGAMTAP